MAVLAEKLLDWKLGEFDDPESRNPTYLQSLFDSNKLTKYHTVEKVKSKGVSYFKCRCCQYKSLKDDKVEFHCLTSHLPVSSSEKVITVLTRTGKLVIDHVSTKVKNKYKCDICENYMSERKTNILRHVKCLHGWSKEYKCLNCHRLFSMDHHLKRHYLTCQLPLPNYHCSKCFRMFKRQRNCIKHEEICKPTEP